MGKSLFLKNRKYETRKEQPLIAIYANGEVTEKKYFESLCRDLRLSGVRVKQDLVSVNGLEHNTKSLVQYVLEQKDESDEVWVVFDKDNQTTLFDDAIKLARKNGINVAYSNECFELWFLLHFDFYNTQMVREEYFKKLAPLLSVKKYEKNLDVYDKIKNNTHKAVSFAEKLEKENNNNGVIPFYKRNPSTTVYLLVNRLKELATEKGLA